MKILIYGSNFAPELTGVGKYSAEMAAWLQRNGHEIRVITAPPHYPEWKIHNAYKASEYKTEEWCGVLVFRVPVWIPKRMSGLKRLLHLASFAISSLPALVRNFSWRPDLVFMTEPPLFIAPATLLFSKFSGSKSWLHIQDFEVDAAFELGILRGNGIRRMVMRFESWILGRFSRVSTISKRMLDLALGKGVSVRRLVLFPNWVDFSGFDTPDLSHLYRIELGISSDSVIALYSGNMGGKQGLEILADAAILLRAEPALHFVFCGAGSGRRELENACRDLTNVTFLDLQPAERLPDFLRMADIHLLPQRAGAADLVMPSKLTGMLASGRPVVATAGENTELAEALVGCGVVVSPGDSGAFAKAIKLLIDRPDLRSTFANAAKVYAMEKLDRDVILSSIEKSFGSCLEQG